MRRVFKYDIPLTRATFDMPDGARIVHVACQHDASSVQLWAEVDDATLTRRRQFHIFGTGHPIPEDTGGREFIHVGTAIAPGGALVWHVYEVIA